MIRVIGYCDVKDKRAGTDDIVFFPDNLRVDYSEIPSPETVRNWATSHGLYPSGKRGAIEGRCEPVYLYIGDTD